MEQGKDRPGAGQSPPPQGHLPSPVSAPTPAGGTSRAPWPSGFGPANGGHRHNRGQEDRDPGVASLSPPCRSPGCQQRLRPAPTPCSGTGSPAVPLPRRDPTLRAPTQLSPIPFALPTRLSRAPPLNRLSLSIRTIRVSLLSCWDPVCNTRDTLKHPAAWKTLYGKHSAARQADGHASPGVRG